MFPFCVGHLFYLLATEWSLVHSIPSFKNTFSTTEVANMTKSWLNTISQKCAFQSSAHKKMAKKINLRENQWHKIWEDYITSCQRGWTSGCCQKYIAAVLIYIIFALALSIQTDNNDKFEHFPFRKGPIFRCLKDYAEQLPRGDVKPVHYFCSGDKQ